MGKIRVKTLGDESQEREQKEKAKLRRDEKKAKKGKVEGVGLKGGERIAVVEGVELPETATAEGETPKEAKKARKAKVRVRSKRYQELRSLVDATKSYPLKNAIELVKKTAKTGFDGSVQMHININTLTLPKDKKTLSGMVTLPHGTGKKRVVVVADDELLERVSKGKIDFDVLVAHPSMMPKLAKVAKILGPRGLMPNPKAGTVNADPQKRAKELEGGEMQWKTEADQPIIHQVVGKASFEEKALEENIRALTKAVGTGKIAKLTLNATMGPGIKVDLTNL